MLCVNFCRLLGLKLSGILCLHDHGVTTLEKQLVELLIPG